VIGVMAHDVIGPVFKYDSLWLRRAKATVLAPIVGACSFGGAAYMIRKNRNTRYIQFMNRSPDRLIVIQTPLTFGSYMQWKKAL